MIVFIKGEPECGKSTLARKLVERLRLEPVDWNLPADLLERAQSQMGGWLDLSAGYFGACSHLDMERVIARLQVEKWNELPRAPRWQPGADPGELRAWHRSVLREICDGRLLADLFGLTCRLVESQRHSVLEGAVLGTRFADSRLTRMLRQRFLDRDQLHLSVARRRVDGDPRDSVVTVNGFSLSPDEAAQVLSPGPDGTIRVGPEIGWTWRGHGQPATPPAPSRSEQENLEP